MLTKRIIAVLLLSKGRVVKTRQFANPRDVGDPVKQAKILYDNGADEIVILNVDPGTGIEPLLEWVPKMAQFIPIAAGGGVRSLQDAERLIQSCAEKVVIRTAVDIIPACARAFGCQSVVQSIDYQEAAGPPPPHSDAGEVLLHCVSRDGVRGGYDTQAIAKAVSFGKPIVALGGCGNYQHMLDAFRSGADACAAGSLWAFTDSNPLRAKKWLKNHGVHVRHDDPSREESPDWLARLDKVQERWKRHRFYREFA